MLLRPYLHFIEAARRFAERLEEDRGDASLVVEPPCVAERRRDPFGQAIEVVRLAAHRGDDVAVDFPVVQLRVAVEEDIPVVPPFVRAEGRSCAFALAPPHARIGCEVLQHLRVVAPLARGAEGFDRFDLRRSRCTRNDQKNKQQSNRAHVDETSTACSSHCFALKSRRERKKRNSWPQMSSCRRWGNRSPKEPSSNG